ncbi:MAG: hypothetical protein HRF42_05040 [Candidatus Brocadia sp.]
MAKLYSSMHNLVKGTEISDYFWCISHELRHLMFTLPYLCDTYTNDRDSFRIVHFNLIGTGSLGATFGAKTDSLQT